MARPSRTWHRRRTWAFPDSTVCSRGCRSPTWPPCRKPAFPSPMRIFPTLTTIICPGITKAFGPGEAGYVAQLRAYDAAFQKFFDRLAKAGIDETNTLFVITVDEGDHFVGSAPSTAN